jgi:hypothetical protein
MDDRQSEIVPSAGGQDDCDAGLVGSAKRIQVPPRNLKLRIQQRAININCYNPDGKIHWIDCTGSQE